MALFTGRGTAGGGYLGPTVNERAFSWGRWYLTRTLRLSPKAAAATAIANGAYYWYRAGFPPFGSNEEPAQLAEGPLALTAELTMPEMWARDP